jgi:transcriptional regulator with GAF, ATPase, and Fis domain
VFLDEIGDMPLNLQAKMLRLLQEKSVERLGGRETIPVDVRIIAATNRNLEHLISKSQFREDLLLPSQGDHHLVTAPARTHRRHSCFWPTTS